MKRVLSVDLGDGESSATLTFLGQAVEIARVGCGGDVERARRAGVRWSGALAAIRVFRWERTQA